MIPLSLNQTSSRRPLALAAGLAALAVATMSVAAPVRDAVPSVKVRYGDLNLATATGVSALYRRISHAAREVCPDSHSRDLDRVSASEQCQAEAIARAVAEVNNPELALMHAERTSHG